MENTKKSWLGIIGLIIIAVAYFPPFLGARGFDFGTASVYDESYSVAEMMGIGKALLIFLLFAFLVGAGVLNYKGKPIISFIVGFVMSIPATLVYLEFWNVRLDGGNGIRLLSGGYLYFIGLILLIVGTVVNKKGRKDNQDRFNNMTPPPKYFDN